MDHTLWGHRLRFEPRGNVSEGRLLFMPRAWDRRERAILDGILAPGMVFVDVGANFGGYTWFVLSRVGSGCTLLALEPDPELNARLRFNLRTNGWSHVRVLPVAVSGSPQRAVLQVHGGNRGQNKLFDLPPTSGPRPDEVQVETLRHVVDSARLTRIDVLKIDIEGLEHSVLRAFFASGPGGLKPRWILCEWQETPEYEALGGLLADEGYVLEHRTRLNRIYRLADV